MTEDRQEQNKAILNLYAALGVSLILSVLPSVSAALASVIFFSGVLIAAYLMRRGAERESLRENHATFIIRTLWIAALFSLFTTGAATIYMLGGVDYAPFEPCANVLISKGAAWIESAGMMEVYALIKPCVESFLGFNKALLVNAVIIAGAPLVIYVVYRLAKGVSRAMKGYRIANPKSWF